MNKTLWQRPFALFMIAVIVGASCLAHWYMVGGSNKKILLLYANWLVDGKHLYGDMVHPNVPMITWLYELYVYASRAFGLRVDNWLAIGSVLWVVLSLLACRALMKRHPWFEQNPTLLAWHDVVMLFLLLVFANTMYFGDREHMIVLLMFPFFLRMMPSLAMENFSLPLRIMVGLMAGFSTCFKPHAVLLIAGIVALRWVRERSWAVFFNLENYLIAAVIAVYLAAMMVYTPDYFTQVFPMLWATYSYETKGLLALQYYIAPLFTLALVLADFRLRHQTPLRRDILYFLGMYAVCLGYVAINNGWNYTFYPINSVVMLLAVWVLWEFRWLKEKALAEGKDAKPFAFGIRACIIAIFFNVVGAFLPSVGYLSAVYNNTSVQAASIYDDWQEVLKEEKARSFGSITMLCVPWVDMVEKSGLPMVLRFSYMIPLPKFLASDSAFAEKHASIMDYMVGAYANDIARNKPDVIFVDDNREFPGLGKPFDIIAHFLRYPAFAESWKHYRLLKKIDHCDDPDIRELANREIWCRQIVYKRVAP